MFLCSHVPVESLSLSSNCYDNTQKTKKQKNKVYNKLKVHIYSTYQLDKDLRCNCFFRRRRRRKKNGTIETQTPKRNKRLLVPIPSPIAIELGILIFTSDILKNILM